MKRKKLLIAAALIAILTALAFLAVLVLWQLGILPASETDNRLFVMGYGFLPVPVVGLAAGILLQVFSVRSEKSKKE